MRKSKALFLLFSFLLCGRLTASGGYLVFDLASGETVAGQSEAQKFNIASNLKMFTSVVALEELGGDFRFSTNFRWEADTLFVQAGGDPVLVMEELYLIGLELKRLGVHGISTVVIDDMLYFPSGCRQVPHAKNDRAYNAPVSALALNYNTYQIDIIDGKVSLKTPGEYFVVKYRDDLKRKIVTRPWHEKLLIEAGYNLSPRRKTLYKRVYHPTNHFFFALCHYLDLDAQTKLVRRKLPEGFFASGECYTHRSKPLKDILHLMNIYSSNFIAESLGCYLGQKKFGDPKAGVNMVERFIQESLGEEVTLQSCSGLGKNYLSVQTILKLLRYVWSKPFLRIDFFAGLPELGKDGTLQKINCDMRVKGKSGSLHNVSALSGLYAGKQQHLYLFAFVENAPLNKAVKKRDKFLKDVLGKF